MKLVYILGPQAVGKMTVGQELAKITGLKLFHNHMTIDLVSNFFPYNSPEGRYLVNTYRMEMFKTVAKSDLKGLIFTFQWCFEDYFDWEQTELVADLFKEQGGEVYYVELEADLEERLRRNETSNRLENKPSKRNVEQSKEFLLSAEKKHRCNSYPGEIQEKNYIRINNNNIPANEVAKMIKEKFDL